MMSPQLDNLGRATFGIFENEHVLELQLMVPAKRDMGHSIIEIFGKLWTCPS